MARAAGEKPMKSYTFCSYAGAILFVGGAIWLGFVLLMDNALPFRDTISYDLIATRLVLAIAAAAVMVCGAVLAGAGAVARAFEDLLAARGEADAGASKTGARAD
jgi:hypothetical protein